MVLIIHFNHFSVIKLVYEKYFVNFFLGHRDLKSDKMILFGIWDPLRTKRFDNRNING